MWYSKKKQNFLSQRIFYSKNIRRTPTCWINLFVCILFMNCNYFYLGLRLRELLWENFLSTQLYHVFSNIDLSIDGMHGHRYLQHIRPPACNHTGWLKTSYEWKNYELQRFGFESVFINTEFGFLSAISFC